MKKWKKRVHKIPEETLQQLEVSGGSVRSESDHGF